MVWGLKESETMAEKMVKAEDCKCCICGKKAYAFWPCIDLDIPQHPYCEKCLREQQMAVIMQVTGKDKRSVAKMMSDVKKRR
jgi:hypothetical protein